MSLAVLNKVSCNATASLYKPKSGRPESLPRLSLDLIAPLTQSVATKKINSILLIIGQLILL